MADAVTEGMKAMGFVPPKFWAYLLACTEFFGGIALILGALTLYAAFALSIAMIVALTKAHGWSYLQGGELAFAYLAANVCLIFTGPAALALDNFLRGPSESSFKMTSGRKEKQPPPGG